MATRRTVTALFTDLVDSTALTTSIGSDAAEEVRTVHFSHMRNALAVHRGTEIKTMGDGFMAVFDSASDALGSAVTMQRAVERHSESSGHAVAIRVGISTGDAVAADGDYFGVPVIEASRLCSAAGAGDVLLSELAVRVAGDEETRSLEWLDGLTLKGLATPLRAARLQWRTTADAGLRVALVDDSVLLREGLAKALGGRGIDVVLEASDAERLYEKIASLSPHVVVLDVRMPPTFTTEGLDAARAIKLEFPGTGVLVLSAEIQPDAARRLLGNVTEGVGYLLKDRVSDIGELVSAIRTIASGGSAIDPKVVDLLASWTTPASAGRQ